MGAGRETATDPRAAGIQRLAVWAVATWRALSGWPLRRWLGAVLVGGWTVWIVLLWATQPRLVPPDLLEADLAEGRVTAYRVVVVEADQGPWSQWPSGPVVSLPSEGEEDRDPGSEVVTGEEPLTVAYRVEGWGGGIRVVDPQRGWLIPYETTALRLRTAGVPEAGGADMARDPGWERARQLDVVLSLSVLVVVVAGPRPVRGTRWFWFWLVGLPLGVGALAFAGLELLRPAVDPGSTGKWPGLAQPASQATPAGLPPVEDRWRGRTGFLLGVVGSILIVTAGNELADQSPLILRP